MTRRIGILGGSFDPVHPGHLALGRAASIALGLDEIRLMPVARSWQKQDARATAEQRMALLRLALQAEGLANTATSPSTGTGTCAWHIDSREIDRGPPTYTIDTLISLRDELCAQGQAGTSVCLILGSDQFARLRFGVGAADQKSLVGHVLGRFDPTSAEELHKSLEKAADAAIFASLRGLELAMNQFNTAEPPRPKPDRPVPPPGQEPTVSAVPNPPEST